MRVPRVLTAGAILALACARAPARPEPEPQPPPETPQPNIDPGRTERRGVVVPEAADSTPPDDSVERMAPPAVAFANGWMPLASTGVDRFRQAHPTLDGRGVLIGILDTGIDPGIPGLSVTSTGDPKILDLRDFSQEGAVPLRQVTPRGDSVEIAGRRLGGFARVVALNTRGPYYGGVIAELPLGEPPASDLNGNGRATDTLPVLVTRATDGWVLLADTDGNRSFAGERPVRDYRLGRERFGWAARGHAAPVTIAVNLDEAGGEPRLGLVFDTGAHGSHVAGIAAGHDLYGVAGFDGVAPGAQLLGLKIANSANGGITTTGAMLRAMDYAIRFAEARRLPLVLNLSFGVGNEIEGRARIDQLVDSVLAQHPEVVAVLSAGNDGPGLSTVGFPGSSRRAITAGATLPASLLPAAPSGKATEDQVAYFSSRGGELAKPDLVTPGVAYSSVPRWNAGDEVKQGTSMAAPHASGLAALLLSAAASKGTRIDARMLKQAFMVTARPTTGAGFVDEGQGIPDLEAAYAWLESARPVPDVEVRLAGSHATAGLIEARPASPGAGGVRAFDLIRPASAPAATFQLRSDAGWLSVPAKVTLRQADTRIEVRYGGKELTAPGAYSGTISGWTSDTLAGPAFRVVVTVVVPAPARAGPVVLRSGTRIDAGGFLRTFFQADSARPFLVRVSSSARGEQGLSFLHEPHGMPYRDESGRNMGSGMQGALYQVDARDAVEGAYEVVAVAPPNRPLTATVSVTQSPVTLHLRRDGERVAGVLRNVTASPATAEVSVQLKGAERVEAVTAQGSSIHRIPFVAPAWATGVVVDIAMDREQWGRFTDFGLTLFDSLGRQLGKQPLNYAVGRLQVALPEGHGDMPLVVGLMPGFADPAGDESWALTASIRLYADSAVSLLPVAGSPTTLTPAPSKSASASFTLPPDPWPMGQGFAPLGVLVARTGGQQWTREAALPAASGTEP